MRRMRTMMQVLVCTLALFAMANAAGASILGDTAVIQYLYPDSSTQYGLSATGVITAGGLTLDLFGNQDVIVYPDSVKMVGVNTLNSTFTSASFNGVSVQDLTNPSAFTVFSVDPASDVVGFDISRVSIVGGLLYINYQGLDTPFNSVAQVDLTSSAVPLPGALLLFGPGLVGLAAVRRKFKK